MSILLLFTAKYVTDYVYMYTAVVLHIKGYDIQWTRNPTCTVQTHVTSIVANKLYARAYNPLHLLKSMHMFRIISYQSLILAMQIKYKVKL